MSSDDDALIALGVTSEFDRSMSTVENFALGFTYLSPVVGAYSLFDICLHLGGAPMIWSYVIAGFGQFLVALIFGEVVSQFPISGGVYPWSRRLVGRKWAWVAAWMYVWALFSTIAAVATGAAPFLSMLIGSPTTPMFGTMIALALIAFSTICNLAGTKFLARVAMFGFIAELVGALVVGGYLLMFHRVQPVTVIFDPMGAGQGSHYIFAFLAAAQLGLFSCYGFEACGDVAEEISEPGVRIPKAMRMTIYVGVGASMFACIALLLAVPDIRAVISGRSSTPLADVLLSAFGPVGAKGVAAVVMVSFMSCVLSLQAAVSRLIYSFARDDMIAGAGRLSKISPKTRVPTAALCLAGVVPAAIALIGLVMQDALVTIVSFAVAGIYIAFQMVVAAALFARLRGWQPSGEFTLGRWGFLVNIAALAYGIGAICNILWPRAPDAPWYANYSMSLGVGAVLLTAAIYMILGRPYAKGSAPYGDAWLIGKN
ncbi:APC family permease [Sphingobium nicotianae]|uniref:Amino acid permease n=1 Tax=Sphingobium nicotianae TaxID=2782607 RepID=A0A9X1IP90_9SPHN|nr:amino acid permease [Sphingobium nicotianae]MBT2186028.1 amino acid permease [Sphingobium nicotianae]